MSPRRGALHRRRLVLIGALCLAVAACAGPVTAVRVDSKVVQRDLARSAITTGEPSWPTRNALLEYGLQGTKMSRIHPEYVAPSSRIRGPAIQRAERWGMAPNVEKSMRAKAMRRFAVRGP